MASSSSLLTPVLATIALLPGVVYYVDLLLDAKHWRELPTGKDLGASAVIAMASSALLLPPQFAAQYSSLSWLMPTLALPAVGALVWKFYPVAKPGRRYNRIWRPVIAAIPFLAMVGTALVFPWNLSSLVPFP